MPTRSGQLVCEDVSVIGAPDPSLRSTTVCSGAALAGGACATALPSPKYMPSGSVNVVSLAAAAPAPLSTEAPPADAAPGAGAGAPAPGIAAAPGCAAGALVNRPVRHTIKQ